MEEGIYRILELARRRSCECEVYGEAVRQFNVEVHRGAVESMERSRDAGVGIRLACEGRIGFAYTSDMAPEGVERAFEEARANAECSSPFDVDRLADNVELIDHRDLFETMPPDEEDRDKVERVRIMESACFDHDAAVANTEGAAYHEMCGDIFVASTRGFSRYERRGYCLCAIAAVARRAGEVRSGSCSGQALHPARIDFGAVGRRAAERAVRLLGSKRIPTKRYPVVIDGAAFVDIVELLAETLSAEMVVKGMSVLDGRRGESVARDIVSVIDDPFRDGCCFNASFDDEGVPKRKIALIESGVLQGYFHNAYSSRRMRVGRPGNAVRRSFKSRPVPGPSNLYVAPGERTAEEIIAAVDEGVYVQDIMGIHTADTISGDFSVGINGLHIRGGTVDGPLSEMTMSGNILTLLSGIRETGRDLVFIGPLGSPTVLVEDISVSGT